MLYPEQKGQCSQHVAFLAMPTNDTGKDSTSFTPPLLIFVQKPQLSTDLSFGVGGQGEEGNRLNRYAIEPKDKVAQNNLARQIKHLIYR